MSLRQLPKIKAFSKIEGMEFQPDDGSLSRWNPAVRSAVEGDENVVSIYDVIGEDMFTDGVTSKRIAGALRRIGSQDVTVNINSPGGDFFEGVAIYNLLREHPAKVTVKVMGLAASAASLIAMAGDEVQISEIGFLMVHNAWAVAMGNRHDMREAADFLEPFDDAMAGLYASRSGSTRSEAAAWMDKETWFNGSQAIEAGLADGIMSDVIETDGDGVKSLVAVRRVEMALAKQGLPRSERRSLIGELKGGKPNAAADAMPSAGEIAALREALSPIKPN
jgi:ATP-dependent Clp protease, protease subunit